jgi:serine/threonine protein kinase
MRFNNFKLTQRLTWQLLEAYKELHGVGICARDIKLKKIFLVQDEDDKFW